MIKKILYAIVAYIYLFVVKVRHYLYDIGALKSIEFDVPVICVGNITVGGTGKTPLVEMAVEHTMERYNVAVLSRGYGRKSRGYIEVRSDHSYREVGDEPLQMKRKFPNVMVVVCEDRVTGIEKILRIRRDINLIIMDDGFQHRSITPKSSIIVVDATRPIAEDYPIPLGSLRDSIDALHRASSFVVSKCPEGMTSMDCRIFKDQLVTKAYQKIFFTRYRSLTPTALFPESCDSELSFNTATKVIAMSGIGNPTPFVDAIESQFHKCGEIIFEDHHVYHVSDLKKMTNHLKRHPKAVIIMTEKDAVKLMGKSIIPEQLRPKLYYIPIEVSFFGNLLRDDFLNMLDDEIKGN